MASLARPMAPVTRSGIMTPVLSRGCASGVFNGAGSLFLGWRKARKAAFLAAGGVPPKMSPIKPLLFLLALSATSLVARAAEADGDYTIAPPYANAPEFTVKDGVPKGAVHEFDVNSADSRIYPGLNGPYVRKVW